jgi:flagellar hook-associated protein 2
MATDSISALGAGSGVDVKSLANSLVEAERAPRKAILEKKIQASEGGISGYAAIKFVLGDLSSAFGALKNQSTFNVMTTRNSQPSAFAVTTSSSTATGNHSVAVTQLAKPQRSISPGFTSSTFPLTASQPINLSLSVHGGPAQTITVPASANTPEGIVSSVNAAGKGVTAQLINTGDPLNPIKIMFTGQSGENHDFQISGLDSFFPEVMAANPSWTSAVQTSQTAQNARLNVDGIDIISSSNKVEGAITGTTLDLYGLTPSNETASVDFLRDTSGIKPKIEALVKAYNDATSMLGVVSDPKSSVETYGATLVGSSLVGTVRSQMRALITTSVTSPSSQPNTITVPASRINLNVGVTLGSATGVSARIAPADSSGGFANAQSLVTAINDASTTTKVSASLDANGNLVLTNTAGAEGHDISVGGAEPNSFGIATGIYKSQVPNALRDIGLSISAQGVLQLDSAKLDSLLQANFAGVVTLFTGNQENLSMYSQAPGGVANSAVKKLTAMLDTNSAISSQSSNLSKKISAYKLDLEKLEFRMTELLARYNKQFGAMESMVGQTNALKTGLTSTFEGMMAAYTK